jgi:hypothetical protein
MSEDLLHAAKLAFSDSYFDARAKFRSLAPGARAYSSPARGRGGESLFTDAAWFGDPSARKLVVVLSADGGQRSRTRTSLSPSPSILRIARGVQISGKAGASSLLVRSHRNRLCSWGTLKCVRDSRTDHMAGPSKRIVS